MRASPSSAHVPSIRRTDQRNRKASTIATAPMRNASQTYDDHTGTRSSTGPRSMVRVSVKRVCTAKKRARFAITPTTAAVTPVSAAASEWLPRSRSTYGAPRKMKTKQGTNVTHTTSSDARTPATHGSSPPGSR